MAPFFYSALLALCGIGTLVHGQTQLVCQTKQRILTEQQTYIHQLEVKQSWEVKWLEETCHLRIPPIEETTEAVSEPEPTITWPTVCPSCVWPTQRPTAPPEESTEWPTWPPIETDSPEETTIDGSILPTRLPPCNLPACWNPPSPCEFPKCSPWPTETPRRPSRRPIPTDIWPTDTDYTEESTILPNIDPLPTLPPEIEPTYQPPSSKIICCTPRQIEEEAKMKTVDLIHRYGYPVETHFVTTTDSYVLCLHRMPRPGAPVILLVHGLMSSSASWVQMGPNNGLAYILYDQGYDVWMLNTRGNIYSNGHKNPNIDPAKYWEFSFHEIGIYDLPATIDLIIEVTQKPKIQYIGHSQGCTAFFVMCSELPQYAHKVILMQAMSPTVYLENTRSPVLKFLGLFKGKLGVLLNLLGGFEISQDNNLISQFREHICKGHLGSKICAIFDFVTCGFGWNEYNSTLTPLIVGHASQGASSLQIYHYAQLLHGLKFQYYDRGIILNQIHYRQSYPPSYNLTQVSCKVALHHSEDDWLATNRDVDNLRLRLPNVIDNWRIGHPGFSHYDYVISKNVRVLVYNRLISNCHKYRITKRYY